VLRTLPNPTDKQLASYPGPQPAPYFTWAAMEAIARLPIQHLVVDLPSVDRLRDGGRVRNHRIYWQLPETGHDLPPHGRTDRTITELVFIPNHLPDGPGLLNLQAPPLYSDAVPSRVWWYPAVCTTTRG
jgi:hypothetical protein